MEKIKTRYIMVIGLLFIFGIIQGGAGYSDYLKGNKENPLKNFPLDVNGWRGRENKLGDSVYRILETDAILVNTYRKKQKVVTLSTVCYTDEKVDFHSPKGCSVGKGDKIVNEHVKSLIFDAGETTLHLEVKYMLVDRANGKKDLIYHFFKSGDFFGASYLRFRYHMGLNLMKTRTTKGALVILTAPVSNDIKATELTLANFIESFYPTWTQYL